MLSFVQKPKAHGHVVTISMNSFMTKTLRKIINRPIRSVIEKKQEVFSVYETTRILESAFHKADKATVGREKAFSLIIHVES